MAKKTNLLFLLQLLVGSLLPTGCEEPHFTTRKYEVVFNTAGGSLIATQTIIRGDKAIRPPDPVRPGYVFLDWYSSSSTSAYNFLDAVISDVTLTAVWLAQSIAINLNLFYAGTQLIQIGNTFIISGLPSDPNLNALKLTAIPLPGASVYKEGSATAEALTNDVITLDFSTKDAVVLRVVAEGGLAEQLYRVALPSYSVTFDLNGGLGSLASQKIAHGRQITEPSDPTRSGYTFQGWYVGSSTSTYDFSSAVTADVALTARWAM